MCDEAGPSLPVLRAAMQDRRESHRIRIEQGDDIRPAARDSPMMMRSSSSRLVFALALALIAISLAACATARPAPTVSAAPPFRPALDAHLRSIEQRQLEGLLATVDDRELFVILPNGKTVGSRAEYEAFHREWFAETDWSMRFTIEKVVETPELAYALTTYTYTDPSGSKARWLLLVFRLSNGAWKLVHDQNTPKD